MEEIYRAEPEMPVEFWEFLRWQKAELQMVKEKTGSSVLPPSYFA
jgi:hypothetical protein